MSAVVLRTACVAFEDRVPPNRGNWKLQDRQPYCKEALTCVQAEKVWGPERHADPGEDWYWVPG